MLKAIVNSPIRSGDQTIVNGDLIVGTAGEGINFTANTPAVGMTSQLLNWYEEGTWTPTYTASVSNPTVTYTFQQGYYTRFGNLVFVYFIIQTSAVSGGSGNLRVSGLPFAASAQGEYPIYGNIVGETADWLSNAPTTVKVNPDSIPSTSLMLDNTTVADMDPSSNNANRLRASLIYRAA